MSRTYKEELGTFVQKAVDEDLGEGDHSSLACIPAQARGQARLILKQEGILAGLTPALEILNFIDPGLNVSRLMKDGDHISMGDIAFVVGGRVHSILKAERLVLNVMQRMSGIATQTSKYVRELEGLGAKILDTRKTTPGMRFLEKEAVRLGGGVNHRMGLYDMIMLKDNHIDYSGGIEQAIRQVREYLERTGKKLDVVVEARNMDEVGRIMESGGVRRILLDNFSIDRTREAVAAIGKQFETESSGGITLQNVREYAECGVDYISVGALTHQINSLDMSLKAV